MNKTLDYYNETASEFFASTVEADMSAQYSIFEKYLSDGACVLDCGCGSGRDSKHFIEQGFVVEAIDGSAELCKKASELTGIDVKNILFQDIDYVNCFDGIWACASLLHLAKDDLVDVFIKLRRALTTKGILYVSFKYGNFEGERNGRFFTDLTEEALHSIIDEVGGFEVKEEYVSGDVRPGRENEKWLNVILIKKDIIEIETSTDLVEQDKTTDCVEFVDDKDSKILRIFDGMKDIDYQGILANLVQCVDIGKALGEVEKKVEYVVRIPSKYKEQFETGELFINKNLKTDVEWPTLMKKMENGKNQFVDNLPIKQQEMIQGNPFHDICRDYNNLFMQQKLHDISESLKTIEEKVEFIEKGQHDDRVGYIDAGIEEITYALSLKDEQAKIDHIKLGRDKLIVGRNQIKNELESRIKAFKAIPSNGIIRFLTAMKTSDYDNKKDDEYDKIQDCYDFYRQATNMLAMSWGITGELDAMQSTYDTGIAFLQKLNTESIKTIEYFHEGSDLSGKFHNAAIGEFKNDKKVSIDVAENYDYLEIEVVGDKLLEVIKDGKVR